MVESKPLKLGEILFEEGLIQREQLQEALDLQQKDNRKLGELLVDQGLIDGQVLTEILARMFQLPYVRLSETNIEKDVAAMVPEELLQTHHVLPIAFHDNCLTIATSDPLNVSVLQEIQYKTGYQVNPVIASLKEIQERLQERSEAYHTMTAMKAVKEKTAQGRPVILLVESIIGRAIKENASDIHFEPQKDHMRVRFRIDGVLYEKAPIPKELERNVISRVKIISGMDVAENRRPQDGRSTLTYSQQEYDIRISTLPDIFGENLVLRILNKQFAHHSFGALGMDDVQIGRMEKLMERPYGLILVTGPTGAGKTTTLYSMLNSLNDVGKNIISVEDPVEYELPGITQTAISTPINYTFATAIRHILRHDPDIIMVGEIRDVETAQMAIRAALTGHLVLSTMHTNSAAGAITRLLEMKIEPFLISSAINGVIAQRLVRKLCQHCKQEYNPPLEVIKNLNEFFPTGTLTFAHAAGCEHCLETGYKDRTGIFEVLGVDEDIREKILKAAGEKEISEASLAKDMKTLRMSGMHKVGQGNVTLEEVIRITSME